jgi:hypothetical protein
MNTTSLPLDAAGFAALPYILEAADEPQGSRAGHSIAEPNGHILTDPGYLPLGLRGVDPDIWAPTWAEARAQWIREVWPHLAPPA